jgi:hypothetical protein
MQKQCVQHEPISQYITHILWHICFKKHIIYRVHEYTQNITMQTALWIPRVQIYNTRRLFLMNIKKLMSYHQLNIYRQSTKLKYMLKIALTLTLNCHMFAHYYTMADSMAFLVAVQNKYDEFTTSLTYNILPENQYEYKLCVNVLRVLIMRLQRVCDAGIDDAATKIQRVWLKCMYDPTRKNPTGMRIAKREFVETQQKINASPLKPQTVANKCVYGI